MVVVRMVFQTRWGMAEQAVKEFADAVEMMQRITGSKPHIRIYTDLSGPFHTVVQEIEVESLAQWEKFRAAMFSNTEMQDNRPLAELPYEGGRTEFYTLEKSW